MTEQLRVLVQESEMSLEVYVRAVLSHTIEYRNEDHQGEVDNGHSEPEGY